MQLPGTYITVHKRTHDFVAPLIGKACSSAYCTPA